MKIELHNKILEDQLIEIAQSENMTLELFISEVLREIVEERSTNPIQVDNTISGIKKEAQRLSDGINIRLKMFEDKYEVNASLVEVTEAQAYQTIPQRYRVKVIL